MLLKLHFLIGLLLLLSHLELVDEQLDDPTLISEVGGCMHDFEGEVNQDPEGDGFLSVFTILANHREHHIADKNDLVSFQSVNRSPQISMYILLYILKAGQK